MRLPILVALVATLYPTSATVAPAALAPPVPPADRVHVETPHYVLESSGKRPETEEWGRMLELAWPQFTAFFGKEPALKNGERLRIAFFDEDAPWRAAIIAGGGTAPDAGGYYCPVARTAYVKRQPSAWYTRTLLLHEAAHQFHYLARTGNGLPGANWYVEGIAEHLGSHTWDGETLRVGVLPLVSLENRAGAAARAIAAADFSFESLLSAESADRPSAMMLVRFLSEGAHRKAFLALARKVDRGTTPTLRQFTRAFGKSARLLTEWRAWLAARQEPLVSVFVEWDSRSTNQLRGTAQVVSFCRTREAVRSVSARVDPGPDGGFRAGVLLHFEDARNYTIATVVRRPNGDAVPRIQIDRLIDGKWKTLRGGKAPAATDGTWFVAAERRADGVVFVLGDERIGPFDLPATPLGFVVDQCRAEFRGVTITH